MATKASKDPEEKKGTRRLPIFLSEEHIAWLKKDKKGASAAVRALIAEAMAMENLAKSVAESGAKEKVNAVERRSSAAERRKRRFRGVASSAPPGLGSNFGIREPPV